MGATVPSRRINDDEREAIIVMRRNKHTVSAIANDMGCSVSSVWRIIRPQKIRFYRKWPPEKYAELLRIRKQNRTLAETAIEMGVTKYSIMYAWERLRKILTSRGLKVPKIRIHRGGRPAKSDDIRNRCIADVVAGASAHQVSKVYGVHRTTVSTWVKRSKASMGAK